MFLFTLSSCKEDVWEDHYKNAPERSDVKIWDAIKDSAKYSQFRTYLIETGFDTVLTKNESFTLFIPTNEAFEGYQQKGQDLFNTIAYHVSPTVVLPSNISTLRKVQTFTGKFADLETSFNSIYFDGIKVSKNSPLFKDGTIYEIDKIALPRPNLYEFTKLYSNVIGEYIDDLDSIAFDAAESTPLYFNEEGQTVYDSIYEVINKFELEYFPVKEESRTKTATFLLFDYNQYRSALNEMADKIGPNFNDYRDIPADWIEEVMMPFYMERGIYDSTLTYNHFQSRKLMNILGDSVVVEPENIDESSRFRCSNGITFKYANFSIPDSLFNDTLKKEGEHLASEINDGNFDWKSGLFISDPTYKPSVNNTNKASFGEILLVEFPSKHKERFTVKFKIPLVFPRKYNLVFQSVSSPLTGELEIAVNGKKVITYDTFYLNRPTDRYNRNLGFSVPNGNFGKPQGTLNWFSIPIDFITEYGDVEISVSYIGPGKRTATNALAIDYIGLFPVEEE